jgi:hypothetical protein
LTYDWHLADISYVISIGGFTVAVLVNVPDIPDSQLIYNEEETRRILRYFWPSQAASINTLTIDNNARRLAQVALIAAVDGSYAMSYVQGLFDTLAHGITHPGTQVRDLVQRLGHSFFESWWQHVTRGADLRDAEIYETVRREISRQLRFRMEDLLMGVALRRMATTLSFA